MNAKQKTSKKKKQTKSLQKKKSKSVSQLKKMADNVFSQYIRQRDGGKCFTCGIVRPWKEMQNGHYVSRGVMALRYNDENCNCQCMPCNVFKNGNYPVYSLRLIEKYGNGIIEKLNKIDVESKKSIVKYGADFYREIIEKYAKKKE